MHAHSVISGSLWPHGLQASRLLYPWDFPGKNIGVGFHFLLQRIFLIQGLNPHLLHWQADSSPLRCLGRPYITYTVYITATTHIRHGAQLMRMWAVWASLATHPLPPHPPLMGSPGPDMAALHTCSVVLPSAEWQVWGEVDEFPPPPLI